MTSKSQETVVTAQFSPRAAAYVTSAVHSKGPDLEELAALVTGHGRARVLDLGCGGGHVGFHVAPHVREVVCYDLSDDMLRAVAGEAARRGLGNVLTRRGAAEALPFAEGSFDFVLSRYSAHHWRDVPAGLREARRVLRPGGRFLCLEFSTVDMPGLDRIYDLFSFKVIPPLGRAVTGDAESYQYLVESIRKFPKPGAFAEMISTAGFSRVSWQSFSGGIVALHSGWRL